MRLKGKTAMITGAAGGLGQAIGSAYVREGACVLIADNNFDGADSVTGKLNAQGAGDAVALHLDVGNRESVDAAFDRVAAEFGGLDILVNNAGVSVNALFVDTTFEDWERVHRINLTGAFLCGQAAARQMIKKRYGRIMNIVSLSGQRGGTGRSAYGSSKAGLEILTKIMAVELAEHGINVNAIAPGPIDTAMTKVVHDQATRQSYYERTPQRRYGEPAEIANAAVFLASDESNYVCGHTLNVDGGFGAAGLMFSMTPKNSDEQ